MPQPLSLTVGALQEGSASQECIGAVGQRYGDVSYWVALGVCLYDFSLRKRGHTLRYAPTNKLAVEPSYLKDFALLKLPLF